MKTFKEKLGPFPLWVWLAGITALGLGYYLYESKLSGSTSSTSSTSSTTPTGSVPQFVIQNQYPVTGSTTSSTKTVGATAGYTEVSEAEAEKDKKQGAKVMYLTTAGLLKSWSGKGSHPGASLWVPTEWVKKHKSSSGKSGPGAPKKVTGPKASGSGKAKAPVKPASTDSAAHRSVASSKASK